MRILILTNLYPSAVDPFRAPFNRQLVEHLAAMHPTSVISPIAWTDELNQRLHGKARILQNRKSGLDGVEAVYPRFYYAPRLLRSLYGHSFKASVAKTFRRVVGEFRPDVVHAIWAYPDGWAGVRLGHEAGLPVVVKVLGSDVRALDQFPRRRRRTIESLRDADGVVAVSNELAGRIAGFGIDKGKIRVIYDGVNPKLFSPGSKTEARVRLKLPPDGLQFLFVGNLVPVKGVDTLISACDLLNRGGLKFALHIVGKGRLGGRLEDQARACNLGDAIRFVGPVAQQDIPDWYRSADVLVLPSRSEGVPNVLLEASACDTPWVATNVGGNPEIAHLGNSRLVQPNSPNDLAIAMKEQAKVNPARPSPSVVRTRLETAMETIEFLDQVIASRRGAVLGEADVAGS